jgi:hypothetical protein
MKKALLIICLLYSSVFAVVGNFNGDCVVDFKDYAIFANDWQAEDANITDPNVDINSDNIVDACDLYLFSEHWLEQEYGGECSPPPAHCTTDPDKATTPDPANNVTSVAVNKVLTWSVADCNGETTLNDVWFGISGNMSKVVSASATHSLTPTLDDSLSYQWRVDTVNGHGTTTGDVWTFETVIINDVNVAAYTYIVKPIVLSNLIGSYQTIITALPADVNAYVQDPISGGQSKITAANLPYKLSSYGRTVWFATSTVGTTHFHYKEYEDSLEKTAQIVVAANPKDCISFDGTGYLTVPDNALLDLSASRGIGIHFMTRAPSCGFLKKHESGKAGYEIGLVNGRICANIYSASGLVGTIKSVYRYDNGVWANAVLGYNGTNNRIELYIYTEPVESGTWLGGGENLMDADYGVSIPAGDYTNDCNLVIGKSNSGVYKYQIDAIRSYALTMTDPFRAMSAIQVRSASGDTESWVPVPVVRFKCNYDGTNNTTTQIYDDVSTTHLIGTFNSSSNVRYYPFFWHWYDSAAFQVVR